MRHRNRLSFINPKTRKPDYWKILQAIFRYGWGWYKEYRAQEVLLRPFNQHLDGRFVLLRNVRIPDLKVPLPPVIVGPTGVFLLYVTPQKGTFRVREDIWEEIDTRSRRFRPLKPNLVRHAMALARALGEHLSAKAGAAIEVQPVLIATDPGTLVDAIRPSVRVVQADGLEHFAREVVRLRSALSADEVEKIVELLAPSPLRQKAEQPQAGVKKAGQPGAAARRVLIPPQWQRYLNFTPKQWLILGVLAWMDILILVGFIILIVLTSAP
ncbi:MAG TPA: hypothetical protein EYP54_07650 [Anaerolineales bacterium]|nr:hypothetical protein [Anaerolineales bacterium]